MNAVLSASLEPASAADWADLASAYTYPNIVYKAISGDEEALAIVIQVTPYTDAAATELQIDILETTLKSIGDEAFAKVLHFQKNDVVIKTLEVLEYSSVVTRDRYPQTYGS